MPRVGTSTPTDEPLESGARFQNGMRLGPVSVGGILLLRVAALACTKGNAGAQQALRLLWPAPTSTSFVSISPLPGAASCLATFCKRTFASFSYQSQMESETEELVCIRKDRKNIASSLKTCVSLRIRRGI